MNIKYKNITDSYIPKVLAPFLQLSHLEYAPLSKFIISPLPLKKAPWCLIKICEKDEVKTIFEQAQYG